MLKKSVERQIKHETFITFLKTSATEYQILSNTTRFSELRQT